jgi:hypothetical protein
MSLKRNIKKDGLSRIREIVDSSEDIAMLEPCLALVKDMIDIENLNHQIKLLSKQISEKEKNILDDERRMAYYLHLLKLSPEEVSAVGDRVKGRMRVIEERAKKIKASEDSENNDK